jgi:alpha-tubulin suppressor-like RCC1 family protein
VPLNSQIQVVFSEPMDRRTITTASVQLLRDGAQVSGRVDVAGDGLRADFVPDSLLARSTGYQLVVTATVTDLSGDALGQPVVVDFITADQATASPVASVTITPGSASLVAFAGDTEPRVPSMVSAGPGAVLLAATARDADGNPLVGQGIAWSNSDTSVAPFRGWGTDGNTNVYVTPASAGRATITATADGVSGTAVITVLRATITPAAATLRVGEAVRLVASVKDQAGRVQTDWDIGWGTHGDAVNVEWNTGLVTGLAPGIQLVYVPFGQTGISLPGGYLAGSAFARITVGSSGSIASVRVEPDTVRTVPNALLFLRATLRDAAGDTTAAPLNWSSSSPGDGNVSIQSWGLAWNEAEVDVSPGGASVFSVTAGAGSHSGHATVISDYIAVTAASLTGQAICVLASSGRVYCEGGNAMGQSGFGITGSPFDVGPVAVTGGHTFTAISSSDSHNCALTTTGDAYCWGSNARGQLGTAAPMQDCSFGGTRIAGAYLPCSPSPVPVAGGHSFVQIAAASSISPFGSGHTCGLTAGGAAYCWGSNDVGQLGDGTTINRATPVPVAGGLSFTTISAGFSTCGLTVGGLAYCWGPSGGGWYSSVPKPVAGGLTFTRITLGCALASDGSAYCFRAGADSLTPVAVAPGLTFTDLSDAGTHQCGLTAAGVVSCWGYYDPNPNDENDEWVFQAPTVLSGGFASLSAGASDLSCGISSGGVAYCWQFPGLTPFKLWGQR